MEETKHIILNDYISKGSYNKNSGLVVDLSRKSRLLPEDNIDAFISAYDVYLDERKNGNKFRLIFNINPYCTNVLFNPFTEIIKYEGSDRAFCLNFSAATTGQLEDSETGVVDEGSILVKREGEFGILNADTAFTWSQREAIRDTQLSNNACGFVYHNGLDIFNNHILRNKTFKSVMLGYNSYSEIGPTYEGIYGPNFDTVMVYDKSFSSCSPKRYLDTNFNTIDDYMRDRSGAIVSEYFPKLVTFSGSTTDDDLISLKMPLHLYQKHDVYSFEESYANNLKEDNGWFGFSNDSSLMGMVSRDSGQNVLVSESDAEFNCDGVNGVICEDPVNVNLSAESTVRYDVKTLDKPNDINKVINSEPYCTFIDMYPTRELFSFNPLYNSYRERLEKNWNYCLTYPSSSITDGFDFFVDIDNGSGKTSTALKARFFDEYQVGDDGTNLLTVYSMCQHGLSVGDTVNLYHDGEVVYNEVEVVSVVSKYEFQVVKETFNILSGWNYNDTANTFGLKRNPSDNSVLAFKRVVNGVECEYYVRVFTRLPNFKFADREINDYVLYNKEYITKNHINLREAYADNAHDFENHIAQLGFSRTPYSDSVSELVYTDDVDVSYLKDNLGRPLHEIYLTIVKNNKGYEKWYGDHEIGDEDVEFSHCFGKNNCQFLYSEFYRSEMEETGEASIDVRDINSYDGNGLRNLNTGKDSDEIDFYTDIHYYGDICCYSPVDCYEQSLGMCMNRFNTVQRELSGIANSVNGYFDIGVFNNGTLTYDEIVNDENTIPADSAEDFVCKGTIPHSSEVTMGGMCSQDEGYYYQAHYRIPIKTLSQSVSSDNGITYKLLSITKDYYQFSGRNYLIFKVDGDFDVTIGDRLTLYVKNANEIYLLTVRSVDSLNSFTCYIDSEDNSVADIPSIEPGATISGEGLKNYVLIGRTEYIPPYAKVIKDGSCRYYWRDVVANGIENDNKVYPFTNGAFYVTQQINFYLRRQRGDADTTTRHMGTGLNNYPPYNEAKRNYPTLEEDDYYSSEEIKEC